MSKELDERCCIAFRTSVNFDRSNTVGGEEGEGDKNPLLETKYSAPTFGSSYKWPRRDSKSGDYAITAIATVLQSRFRHAVYIVFHARESSCFCAYFAEEGRGRKQEERKGRENWGISAREKRPNIHIDRVWRRSSLAISDCRNLRRRSTHKPHSHRTLTSRTTIWFIDLSQFHFPIFIRSLPNFTGLVRFAPWRRTVSSSTVMHEAWSVWSWEGVASRLMDRWPMRAPASHRLGQVSDKARSRQVARKLARSSLAPPPRPPPPPPNRHERKKKKKEKEERRRRKILRPPFFYVSRSLYIYIYTTHIHM